MQDCTKAIRVLLTDSRPVILAGLANLINAEKPRMEVVGEAASYATALNLSDQLRPDIVLLSFFPDALDPIEVIASLTHSAKAKVLLMKGFYEAIPVAKAIEAGALGVVLTEDATDSITRAIAQVQDHNADMKRVWAAGLSRFAAQEKKPSNGDPEQARLSRLTARELELIRTIVANPSAKYIAIGEMLGISEHTVHNHLSRIYNKLGLVNRLDLLVFAMQHQILEEGHTPSQWLDLT